MTPNRDVLADVTERLTIAIAMQADESLVGVDGDAESYERWHDALHEAIDNGLEAAERRANINV